MADKSSTHKLTLREKAEEQFVALELPSSETLSSVEIQRLFHELQVHQIELEMQNEQLGHSHAELEGSRKQYFDLYDLAPIGYLTLNAQGLIRKANRAATAMLGIDRDVLIMKPLSKYIVPEDQDHFSLNLNNISETGKPQGWEMRLVRADGTPIWASLQGLLAAYGEYWIAFSDITELKRLEAELIKSEALYHSLVEISQDLIWQCDPEGRYTFLNPAWKQVFGYELNEMLGKKFTDFQLDEAGDRGYGEHVRLMAGNSVTGYEATHIGKAGNEIHLVFNARHIEDKRGNIIGTSGSAYDITEQRKKLESEAVTSEKKNRLLSTFIHDYSAALDPTGDSNFERDFDLDHLSSTFQNDESSLRNKKLTRREREVLLMVGQGISSKKIAEQMGIRLKTVEMHRSHLMKKLGTVNAASLGRWAIIAAQMTTPPPKMPVLL